MENFKSDQDPNRKEPYPNFENILEAFAAGKLPLNEVQQLVGDNVSINTNQDTWVSSTVRKEGKLEISIGEKLLPQDVLERWGWGVDTPEGQFLIKTAHEYAHAIQNGFDGDLIKFLDGSNDISEASIPYIQLYALLTKTGPINGLSKEQVYHLQNQSTGNLEMRTFEDIAESLGSYLLGNDYLAYRISKSLSLLNEDDIFEFSKQLNSVFNNWKAIKAQIYPTS